MPVHEIFVALTADSDTISEVYHKYSQTGCKVKLYDSPIKDLTSGSPSKRMIREFQIEDLLFRKPIAINDEATLGFYGGKTISLSFGTRLSAPTNISMDSDRGWVYNFVS